ncbi:MAG: ankyrin repeat domain-containing protein [Candidatus Berkiellales bacterium]
MNKSNLLQHVIDFDLHNTFATLIDVGFNIENRSFDKGLTALNFAVVKNKPDFIIKLIENNANVNTRDSEGYTPIHHAFQANNDLVIDILMNTQNVDINIPSNKRKTALETAFYEHHNMAYVDNIIAHPSFDATYHQLILNQVDNPELLNYLHSKKLEIDPIILGVFEQAKRFGMQYDLKGCFTLNGLADHQFNCFKFGASNRIVGVNRFTNDFNIFFNEMVNPSTNHIPKWAAQSFAQVKEALNFAATDFEPKHYYEKIKLGEIVYIPSGWVKHAVDFVFHDDKLYRCNRSKKHTDGIHGIEVFQITQIDNLNLELITKIMTSELTSDFIQIELVNILGLVKIGEVENPVQVAGNCRWTSMEAGLEATLISSFIDQGLNTEKAYPLAKRIFNLWEEYDIENKLKGVIDNKENLLSQGIYDDLLLNALKYHHDPLNESELQKGVVILNELSEPTLFETFDTLYGQMVMQYNPEAYKQISYLAPYSPLYSGNKFLVNSEKTFSITELAVAKEFHEFLKACDDYQQRYHPDPIRVDEVLDLPTHHRLEQIFVETISDPPSIFVPSEKNDSPLTFSAIPQEPELINHEQLWT